MNGSEQTDGADGHIGQMNRTDRTDRTAVQKNVLFLNKYSMINNVKPTECVVFNATFY